MLPTTPDQPGPRTVAADAVQKVKSPGNEV